MNKFETRAVQYGPELQEVKRPTYPVQLPTVKGDKVMQDMTRRRPTATLHARATTSHLVRRLTNGHDSPTTYSASVPRSRANLTGYEILVFPTSVEAPGTPSLPPAALRLSLL